MATFGDMVSLATVKALLGISDTTADAILPIYITAATRRLLTDSNRNAILPTNYTEIRNGNGKQRMMMVEWPVNSMSVLSVNGFAIPSSTSWPTQPGYLLDDLDNTPPGRPQSVYLNGYTFDKGLKNVVLGYNAGYQISGEVATVPSGSPYTITAQSPLGIWGSDVLVAYSPSGVALVPTTSAPTIGQYSVDTTKGIYTFAAADAGKSVSLSYGFIPADLSLACAELVMLEYKYRSRIGELSQSLPSGGTMAFSQDAYNARVKSTVQQYSRVVLL